MDNSLAIATESGDRALELETLYRAGQAHFAIGDYRQALDLLSGCVRSAREVGSQLSPLVEAWSLAWLGLTLTNLGRFDEARTQALRSLSIAERLDHPFTLAETLTCVGGVSIAQGDYERAIEALERAQLVVRTWKLQPWAVLGRLGYAFALSGRLQEGRELLHEVVQTATTMSFMGVGRAMQLAWLGEACLLEGRFDDALRFGNEALALARRHEERGHEAWSIRLLGAIASSHGPGDVQTADGYYREALGLASELGMRPLAAHCHFQLGKLLRHVPKADEARHHLGAAGTMYREMSMGGWLEQLDGELHE